MLKSPISNVWFQHWYRKPQARLRLFCFPYAGGGASVYRSWSECLPPEIEVCPIQLPGRENRLIETPFSCVTELVESLTQVLLPYLDMPYALFGHSMGALISFELARAFSVNAPAHLLVSGRRAPHLPTKETSVYNLPEAEFCQQLRSLNGTPEEVLGNDELLQLLLPLLRADFELCETYQYRQDLALSCPITAYGGLQDSEVPLNDLVAWKQHTYAAFHQRFFVGDHFFLHPQQSTILEALTRDLLQDLQVLS